MNTIHIRYEGLSPTWTGDAVSGQIGTLKCLFDFDESWSEYNTVYMVVAKGNTPYDPVELDETKSAEVQEIALQERCILSIGAVGLCEKDGKIFRYNGRPCRIAVDQGNLIPDPNKEPDENGSETAYEQVLLQLAGKLNVNQGTENAGRVLVVGDDGIVRPGEYAGGGGGTITEESDPTVPAWAKQPQKPTYTAAEVGALSESELESAIDSALAEAKESGEFDGEDGKSGVYVGGDPIPSGYNVQIDPGGESVELVEVDAGLTKSGYAADAKVVGDRFKEIAQEAPVQSVNGKTGAVKLSASDVGADASGTADTKVSAHNTSNAAHNDIRQLITELTSRLNALADSDDTTLDQMSELVAYIKSNKSLIDSITTSKVSVADIIDNLTTSVSNKPLSAKMGVELKKLIDAIKIPTTLPASDVYSWAKQPQKPTYTPQEIGAQPVGDYALKSEIPTVPVQSVNGKTGAVKLSASDVSADASGTADSKVSAHNTSSAAHNDIRQLIDAIKIPTTLPASDVYSWAKQPTKPTYTAAEVGAATESYVGTEIERVVGDINTLLSQI